MESEVALERITRDQMLAEFGETGVQNPTVIDLITSDGDSEAVVLVMIERRAWAAGPEQLGQIEEKVNRYMGYALDGFLEQHYPQHRAKPVRIRLDCAEAPHGEAERFVRSMAHAIRSHGLEFALNVVSAPKD